MKASCVQILRVVVFVGVTFAVTFAMAQDEPYGGQPSSGSKPSVPDLEAQAAYQRAFEATLWAMPASAAYRLRMGILGIPGMADNVIMANSKPLSTIQEAITGNQVTPYLGAVTDLRNGPIVLEVPAATAKGVLYGQVVDAWQSTIAGVGPVGEDKGAGGKYLFLPPGYKDPIPSGYFPIQSTTYRVLCVFRSVQLGGATQADAYAYSKTLKMYPLSEAANPKPTKFVDGNPHPLHSLPFYDIRALQDIYDIVSVEPVQPRDKVMMGILARLESSPANRSIHPQSSKLQWRRVSSMPTPTCRTSIRNYLLRVSTGLTAIGALSWYRMTNTASIS